MPQVLPLLRPVRIGLQVRDEPRKREPLLEFHKTERVLGLPAALPEAMRNTVEKSMQETAHIEERLANRRAERTDSFALPAVKLLPSC
jgi:hypothetical protein